MFRWREARSAGLSDPALHRLLAEGRLERISHGLYLQVDTELAAIHAFDAVANVIQGDSVNLERAALSSALDVVRCIVG